MLKMEEMLDQLANEYPMLKEKAEDLKSDLMLEMEPAIEGKEPIPMDLQDDEELEGLNPLHGMK